MFTRSLLAAVAIAFAVIVVQWAYNGDKAEAAGQATVEAQRSSDIIEVVFLSRLDCALGRKTLHQTGYSTIVTHNCAGDRYHYTAQRNARQYRATMNPFSGSMTISYAGPARSR